MSGRVLLGIATTISIASFVWTSLSGDPGVRTLAQRLSDQGDQLLRVTVTVTEQPSLQAGDPVFVVENEGFAPLGRVLSVDGPPWRITLELDPFSFRRLHDETTAVVMTPDHDLGWIVKTLFPPDLRKRLSDDLKQTWESNSEEFVTALEAPALALARDVVTILKETLPDTLEKHGAERQAFFQAFTKEVFQDDLATLVQAEFVTRIEKRLTPVALQVARDVFSTLQFWDKVKLGWAAAREDETYLKVFAAEHVMPALQKRGPAFLQASVAAVRDGLADPSVRAKLDKALQDTIEHETFRAFTGAVMKTWVLENEALRKRVIEAFASSDFRLPIDKLFQAAEPRIEKVLEDALQRDEGEGMDHQLVRILRRVLLWKDLRYVLLQDGGTGALKPGSRVSGTIGQEP